MLLTEHSGRLCQVQRNQRMAERSTQSEQQVKG